MKLVRYELGQSVVSAGIVRRRPRGRTQRADGARTTQAVTAAGPDVRRT